MEHSIASAIRTVGAQICRRLDVLIEAAGKPPVEDIEGTPAPRKPLAASAQKQSADSSVASAKKRGRPRKNQTPTAVSKACTSGDDDEETPPCGLAEVSAFYFLFYFVLLIPGRFFTAPNTSCFLLFMEKRVT